MTTRQLIAATSISLLGYCFCFLFVLHKPLTVGAATQYYQLKNDYLKETQFQKRILIFAGSNGRFSHRCSWIEQSFAVKCVNLSLAAGSNLEWQFRHYVDHLAPGDTLYLPLEYKEVNDSLRGSVVGEEATYIVAYDHRSLWEFYSPKQALAAMFSFDIRYALSSATEMLMNLCGVKRRYSTETMDKEGDEIGHSLEKGRAYIKYVAEMPAIRIDLRAYTDAGDWREEEQIIKIARDHGVRVIGGLPTTTEDALVPEQVVHFLKEFYSIHGACFVELPKESKYPRTNFYDSQYHLSEPFQIQHTAAIAPELIRIMEHGTCD